MNLEIERKFLVRGADWRGQATASERLSQGYLANTASCSIRVRTGAGRGSVSVKGRRPGRVRPEYDYAIPASEAAEMLSAFAEIELDSPDEEFPRPPWLGDEVTEDARFYNFRLASEPFGGWPESRRQTALRGRNIVRDRS